jgi:hypothetical protein
MRLIRLHRKDVHTIMGHTRHKQAASTKAMKQLCSDSSGRLAGRTAQHARHRSRFSLTLAEEWRELEGGRLVGARCKSRRSEGRRQRFRIEREDLALDGVMEKRPSGLLICWATVWREPYPATLGPPPLVMAILGVVKDRIHRGVSRLGNYYVSYS